MSAVLQSPRLRPGWGGAVRTHLRLNAGKLGWALVALALSMAEGLAVPFLYDPVELNPEVVRPAGTLSVWGSLGRLDTHLEGSCVSLLILPTAFAVANAIGQRRSLTRRDRAVMWTQSVTPVRWFLARFGVLAAVVVLLGLGTMTALECASVHWAIGHDLMLYTRTNNALLLFLLGPATVALALFGLAAGALAGALLRRPWVAAPVAGVGTLLLTWANSHSTDLHGLLRLKQTGSHTLISGVSASGYWLQQLLHTTVLLGLAALAVLATVRVLRRRYPD